jgi:hypothetical protein
MCNVSPLKERNTITICCGRGKLHGVNSLMVIRMHGSSTAATIMSLTARKRESFWTRHRIGPSKINLNLTRSISTIGASKEVFGAVAERRTAGSEQRTSHVRRHSRYDILQLVSRSSEETVDLFHADWQVALRSWGPFLRSK